MRMEYIRKALAKESAKRFESTEKALNEYDSTLERESTRTRWNNYKTGKASRAETVELALQRFNKKLAKEENKKIAIIEKAETYKNPVITAITIRVDWKRNRTWGYNPTATVEINNTISGCDIFTGSASGCGYDKRSTAIANALNQSEKLQIEFLQAKEKQLQAGKEMPYGCGYSALPYFEGACGYETIRTALELMGFKPVIENERGKTDDFYYFERG